MRIVLLMLALVAVVLTGSFAWLKRHPAVSAAKFAFKPSQSYASAPNFDTQIKPIFEARCQHCHFQGGQVYDKMPFDKAETITRLGTKLFTRIKDEKEQKLIREFLDGANAESKDR